MLTKIKCAEQGKRVAIQRCLTAGLLCCWRVEAEEEAVVDLRLALMGLSQR